MQELNAAFQPVAEVERISAKSFTREFKAEPNILAMPVVTPDLSHFEARSVTPQPQNAAPAAPKPVGKAADAPAANPGFAPLEMAKAKSKLPDSVQVITGKAEQPPLPARRNARHPVDRPRELAVFLGEPKPPRPAHVSA